MVILPGGTLALAAWSVFRDKPVIRREDRVRTDGWRTGRRPPHR